MQSTRHRWQTATDSFWFIPATLLLVSLVLAELLVALDRSLVGDGVAQLPFVSAVGPSGSRDLLAAIGGSMLGVAATSFSITISVIATASSTYGPRLVRNFMANRGNQVVLGIFGATFLYALLVLRTIREETASTPAFVPHLAVTVAIALAVVDVAVLIYFIHHIADSIQVSTLASQVLDDLRHSVDQEQPHGHAVVDPAAIIPRREPAQVVRATTHGYLQFADHAALLEVAARSETFLRLRPRCGDHSIAGDVLVEIWATDDTTSDGALDDQIRRALVHGRARTPQHDVRYAVQQIVELAVRALSPSTNDPYTAINALTELGTGLAAVVDRDDPGNAYERDGHWRLLAPGVPAAELVELALDQVRSYAAASTEVVLHLLTLCADLRTRTDRTDVVAAIDGQQAALLRQFLAAGHDLRDRERVQRLVESHTAAP